MTEQRAEAGRAAAGPRDGASADSVGPGAATPEAAADLADSGTEPTRVLRRDDETPRTVTYPHPPTAAPPDDADSPGSATPPGGATPPDGATPRTPDQDRDRSVDPDRGDASERLTSDLHTVVIEDGVIPRRLRRPIDLARLFLALVLMIAVVLLAYFATSTTEGISEDITEGAALLPDLVVLGLNIVGGIGLLGLPIAVAINLLVRRRGRQLFDALVALLLSAIALTATVVLLQRYADDRLLVALAGSTSTDSVAVTPILGGLISFVTVARLMSRRRWNVAAFVIIGSLIVVTVLTGGITLAGVALSALAGWAIGLLVRYVLGTPTTRPSGVQVADAMARGGYPLTVLRASQSTLVGRRYVATTRVGATLEVVVLDRDLEGAGLASSAWRALRLRDDTGNGAFNMRRTLEHSALMAYAAQQAGAPVPRLLVASEVGPDSSLLAYERVQGTRFATLGDDLTDEDLEGAWRALRTLHEHQLAHRALNADHLLRDPEGQIWLLGTASGTIAAGDVTQRIDIAELLCTLALLTSSERAIGSGRRVLGVSGLSRALPVLQPVALSTETRRAMRKRKDLMVELRDGLVEIRPDADTEQIRIERIRPRTVVMVVLGSVAAYLLLSQLGQVDLVGLVRNASWEWMVVALLASLVTYVGAAWSLSGFVPERLSLWKTMLAQVAGDFATLVSPPTLGAIAINLRFLQKSGLHPALAAASVGVSQVFAFVTHILLLLGVGVAAGTQADFSFDPPPAAVIAVVAVLVILAAMFLIPAVRRAFTKRVAPLLKEVVPRLVTVAQRPLKLVEGVGGILLLNAAYVVVLVACVKAFGGELGIAAIAFVYLAGATIGQAAPTPGGLGAVEAALAAGLTAAGLDSGIAVSAVLLFRLFTFWLPTLPGYAAFNYLQKQGLL
ncbi:MAG: flippase-like domain-containing protein [Candidatus Nanopelagicales bacterium]